MNGAQVDILSVNRQGLSGGGAAAARLLSNGMSVHALRPWIGKDGRAYQTVISNGKPQVVVTNAATLRKDEWIQYDEAIAREARIRLSGVSDLTSRGLVFTIANGLGKTILETETLNEFLTAQLSMDGLSRGVNDRANYVASYLPLPLVHCDYFINARVLAASRNTGEALDTTNAEMAARAVTEKIEDMLFNGASSYAYGDGTIYGYRDYTNRNTGELGAAWDASGVTGADIVNDILAMKQVLIGDRFYGPYVVYVPTAYETKLDEDYSTAKGDITIRQRILQIQGISDIKVSDKMSQNASGQESVIMVQMTSDVVRLVSGMEISPVEWQEQGGMVLHYKVMGIKVPQIRSTQAGRCGIVHFEEP